MIASGCAPFLIIVFFGCKDISSGDFSSEGDVVLLQKKLNLTLFSFIVNAKHIGSVVIKILRYNQTQRKTSSYFYIRTSINVLNY